ncbi:hypothetical protein DSO57_1013176 [Entomophthora muscae]|uniref:Uncharacterized protein n=1 Tax=Entomophthora muscae TaxID=34485 RepID=A0ACC2URH3_9FUNG|nr:hypothetical protein DSO57_1013176 [Entomophthora muscae]
MGICFPTNRLRQPPTHSNKPRTCELLSNLTNAQEAIQLYLNKKIQKEGSPGEEGDDVNIDNSFPLETQAQEQDLNPDPGSPRLLGLWTAGTCFFGINPLQAEAPTKPQSQNTSTSSTMVAPKEEPLELPNGGRDDAYMNFMSLKSSQVTHQELTQERGTGPRPDPMTTTLEQDNQLSSRSPSPPAPLPAVFCPPGVPFGPVHFTKYPLKPKYKDYTLEKVIKLDPLTHIHSPIRYNHQGLWIFSTPKLFREKFNYLLAYNIYMEPPVTPKPMPASSPNLPTNHTSKLFGIVYITLTGVMNTIVLAAGPWSWVGKSAYYLLKLAPLLWWALPAKKTQTKLPPKLVGQPPKSGSLTTRGTGRFQVNSCGST